MHDICLQAALQGPGTDCRCALVRCMSAPSSWKETVSTNGPCTVRQCTTFESAQEQTTSLQHFSTAKQLRDLILIYVASLSQERYSRVAQ